MSKSRRKKKNLFIEWTLSGNAYVMHMLIEIALTVLTILESTRQRNECFRLFEKNKIEFCSIFDFRKSLNSIMMIKMSIPSFSPIDGHYPNRYC